MITNEVKKKQCIRLCYEIDLWTNGFKANNDGTIKIPNGPISNRCAKVESLLLYTLL